MIRIAKWLFRDRSTGRIVVVQWPNLPLWIFIGAAGARRLARPSGVAETILSVGATVSLVWWAVGELARGVNPFRRILGGIVLGFTLAGVVMR